VSYEWTATGEWSNISDGAPSGTGNFLGFTAKTNTSNAQYSATITVTPKIGTCTTPDENKKTFTIKVNPKPTMNNITDTTVCSGGTVNKTFGTTITGTTVTYSWIAEGDYAAIGLVATGEGNISFTTNANNGTTTKTATVRVTPKIGTSCSGDEKTFKIIVNPKPTVNNITDTTVCSGGTVNKVFGTTITSSTVSYSWIAEGDYAAIGLAANGTGNITFTTNANTGTTSKTAKVTVTPKIGTSCNGDTEEFTITVNPVPKMNDLATTDSQAVCSGSTINGVNFGTPITLSSPTLTYEWSADDDWSNITDNISHGDGNFAGFTAKANTSSGDYTSTVTVTPKIGGCAVPDANKKKFTLTVYKKLTAGSINVNQSRCYNTKPDPFTSSAAASGGTGTTIYTWQWSVDGTTWNDFENSNSTTYNHDENLTQTTHYRRRVTNVCGTVYSNTVTVTVRNAVLYNYPDLRIRVCPEGVTNINLSKYIDTLDLLSPPQWVSLSGAPITGYGVITTNTLGSYGVHTFSYTVNNPCASVTRKVYVETLKSGRMRPFRDTIMICKDRAEIVQINQIFGIDAKGTWSYKAVSDHDIDAYVTELHSTLYGGAVTLNGKALYESGIAKQAVFTYKPAPDSCLGGKSYQIVIILTEN
jgi:hypothetical protein